MAAAAGSDRHPPPASPPTCPLDEEDVMVRRSAERKAAKAEVEALARAGGGRGATGVRVVDRLIVAVTCPPLDSRRGRRRS